MVLFEPGLNVPTRGEEGKRLLSTIVGAKTDMADEEVKDIFWIEKNRNPDAPWEVSLTIGSTQGCVLTR